MVLNFNDFNGFNKLSGFKNGDMIILPNGLYQKVTNDYVKYLKLVTLFNEGQYEQALDNLDEGTRRQMQNLVNLQPSETFEIVKCPSGENSTQDSIYNTALSYLQSSTLGNRTFKIQLYLKKQSDGTGAFIAYVPIQYSDTQDKRLAKLKSSAYLLAEYYFSQGDININAVQEEKALIPHLVVMCQNFGENYSLTKDAQYYTISYDPQSEANITTLLDDNLRDEYFLALRKSLDTEIKRIVGSKKNNSSSIINYRVNPDIVLSKYKKEIKILNSYQNLNLQEPIDDFNNEETEEQHRSETFENQNDNEEWENSGEDTVVEENNDDMSKEKQSSKKQAKKKEPIITDDLLEPEEDEKPHTIITTPPMGKAKPNKEKTNPDVEDSNDEKDNPFAEDDSEDEATFGEEEWDD